jgi:outer membrane protein
MKSLVLLLLAAVMLCGFTARPATAADQPDALAPAIPTVPVTQQPLLGPLAVPSSAKPATQDSLPTASVKVGVIDMERVSSESTMGMAASATVKEQLQKLQKQLDSKKRQLEKMREDIERKMPTLLPAQRESKSKEFQKKVEEMKKFAMSAEKEMTAIKEKLTKKLLAAIEQAAVEIGKTKKLAAVVAKREMLYLDSGIEVLDLSDETVSLVNARAPQK